MKAPVIKPNAPVDTFYKRLGWLTASLPARNKETIRASRIIAHRANMLSLERRIEREEAWRAVHNEWFINRPSAKRNWYESILGLIEEYETEQN